MNDKFENSVEKITCSMGMTINLGKFESIKFDTSIEIRKGDMKLEDVYKQSWDKVRDEILKKASEAKGLKNK